MRNLDALLFVYSCHKLPALAKSPWPPWRSSAYAEHRHCSISPPWHTRRAPSLAENGKNTEADERQPSRERKGKERKGKERKGKERKGKERKETKKAESQHSVHPYESVEANDTWWTSVLARFLHIAIDRSLLNTSHQHMNTTRRDTTRRDATGYLCIYRTKNYCSGVYSWSTKSSVLLPSSQSSRRYGTAEHGITWHGIAPPRSGTGRASPQSLPLRG